MDEIRSHHFEKVLETIVGIYRGIESFQGFFGGRSGCRGPIHSTSEVLPPLLSRRDLESRLYKARAPHGG